MTSTISRVRRAVRRTEPGFLKAGVLAAHPGFRQAVMADARAAAGRRGERNRFRSRTDAALQVLRLMAVTDSFFAQVCYRAKARAQAKRIPVLPHVLHHLAVICGQICIGDPVVLEPGVYIPHGHVVLDAFTRVKPGVTLSPFITLGRVVGVMGGPTIEPFAEIGTGAKVLGPVTIGARARVGANAVVLADVPRDCTAIGIPARIVASSPRG